MKPASRTSPRRRSSLKVNPRGLAVTTNDSVASKLARLAVLSGSAGQLSYELVEHAAGTQFDPDVVVALHQVVRQPAKL